MATEKIEQKIADLRSAEREDRRRPARACGPLARHQRLRPQCCHGAPAGVQSIRDACVRIRSRSRLPLEAHGDASGFHHHQSGCTGFHYGLCASISSPGGVVPHTFFYHYLISFSLDFSILLPALHTQSVQSSARNGAAPGTQSPNKRAPSYAKSPAQAKLKSPRSSTAQLRRRLELEVATASRPLRPLS